MKIELPGTTHEIRLAVKISEILENPRDWILALQPLVNSAPVPSKDLKTLYSAALDVNYFYLPNDITNQWNSLESVESTFAFDSLELKLLQVPWAKDKIKANNVEIIEIKYAAKSVVLTPNAAPVHIMGRV